MAKLEASITALNAKSNTPTDEDVGYRLLTAKLRKRIKELEDELARLRANVPIAGVGMLLDKHLQEGVLRTKKIRTRQDRILRMALCNAVQCEANIYVSSFPMATIFSFPAITAKSTNSSVSGVLCCRHQNRCR